MNAPNPFGSFFPSGAPKKRAKPIQHEMIECKALRTHLEQLRQRHLITYTHIANGGQRPKKTAGDLKAMGMRSGVWDYMFRRLNRSVCWLEMKHGDNDLSQNQKDWRSELEGMGDLFLTAWSAKEALLLLQAHDYIPSDAFKFSGNVMVMNVADYPIILNPRKVM